MLIEVMIFMIPMVIFMIAGMVCSVFYGTGAQ